MSLKDSEKVMFYTCHPPLFSWEGLRVTRTLQMSTQYLLFNTHDLQQQHGVL
jgi:hypothetical protein